MRLFTYFFLITSIPTTALCMLQPYMLLPEHHASSTQSLAIRFDPSNPNMRLQCTSVVIQQGQKTANRTLYHIAAVAEIELPKTFTNKKPYKIASKKFCKQFAHMCQDANVSTSVIPCVTNVPNHYLSSDTHTNVIIMSRELAQKDPRDIQFLLGHEIGHLLPHDNPLFTSAGIPYSHIKNVKQLFVILHHKKRKLIKQIEADKENQSDLPYYMYMNTLQKLEEEIRLCTPTLHQNEILCDIYAVSAFARTTQDAEDAARQGYDFFYEENERASLKCQNNDTSLSVHPSHADRARYMKRLELLIKQRRIILYNNHLLQLS